MVGVLSGWTLLRYLMDTPQPARTIQDHGGLRPLDPESESEAEVLEDPCEAVLVGLTHGGKPRALANEPCRDQAAGESVRLLECDKGLSDVKGRQAVRLCDHHRQLYVAACSGRKCSVLSCYESHDGAKQGVPLCKHHLMDVGSSVRSKRKVTWESDGSNPEAEEPSSGVEGHFEDQRGVSPQARSSRPKRRAATSQPKARASSAGPQSQFQHQAEGRLLQGPCISLIRFKSLQNGESLPRWVAFLGRVTGVATSSRAQEKVEIDIPALKVQGVVHLSQLRPPPRDDGHGRICREWIDDFLQASHEESVGKGISFLCSQVTEEQALLLQAWDGQVTDGESPSFQSGKTWICSHLQQEVLPHAEAYVVTHQHKKKEFMTPPRPTAVEDGAGEDLPDIPPFPVDDEVDTGARLNAARDTLLAHSPGDLSAETVQTVATAFEVDPTTLMQQFGIPKKPLESAIRPAAPAPSHTPPGLEGPFKVTTPQIPAPAPSEPASGHALVIPGSKRIPNPLLGATMPGQGGGGISLFPKRSSGSKGLVKPAVGGHQFGEERAGATFGESLGEATQVQNADRIIHAIDGLRKAQDEEKNLTKGSLTSVREAEKMDVFLARGCGTLTVEIAPGVYGKELYHACKRIAMHSRHMLHLIKWPVLMTNRLMLGIAGFWWGGVEPYTVHASDCVTARSEQLDNWHPPSDNKIEGRVKPPGVFNTWLRYAENSIRVFGSCYGTEHVAERMECLTALKEAHEEDEHAFPAAYCIELYEELVAAWGEDLRESRRKLCSICGTENPRLEDLKLLALAPGADGQANFQFPRIWDLADPAGYYQTVVIPRQQRQMSRLLHKQLHDQNLKNTRKIAGGAESVEGGDDDKPGKAPKLVLKDVPPTSGGALPSGNKSAYPAGKRLLQSEASRSVEHAPKDSKSGKPICWDAATHMGCSRGSKCQHAHEPLPGLGKLDYTVAMQVIRRGGLKGGPKIDPKEVDGRVAQLRAQAAAEKAEKMQPTPKAKGRGKPKSKAKAGHEPEGGGDDEDKAGEPDWEVPEDYRVPLTQLEADLEEAVKGPDPGWLEVPRREPLCSDPRDEEALSDEERSRIQRWKTLEASGVLQALKDPSDYLRSHVIARLMAAEDAQQDVDLPTILEEAAEQGHPTLAEEACRQLEGLEHTPKAGHKADAEFEPLVWEGEVGRGSLKLFGRLHEAGAIACLDFQDKLRAADTGVPLGNPQEFEERQCLPLHVGIGIALATHPQAKQDTCVQRACTLRRTLWEEGVAAQAHLGDPPAWITETEHFLRQNIHDCVYPHHEKDYRTLQTLSRDELKGVTLVVMRISYFGRMEVDLLHGEGSDGSISVFVSIHRGHMRLLQPESPTRLIQSLRREQKISRELTVEPWAEALDNSRLEDQLVPAKLPTCARCQQQQKRPYRVGEPVSQPPASLESCLEEDPQALTRGGTPLRHRLAFAYGPVGQEVYAGWAGWTKGLEYQGIPCGEPLEYFEDPLRQQGYKPDHDLRNPDIQSRLKGLAGAPPGPDVPNVWQLGVVCTSFCDHQLKNGGTRTWEHPEGEGIIPNEIQGNEDAAFAAELATILSENGRLFAIESSAPSGRYPKLWDLPCMKKLRQQTGARIVPMAMCAWGLGPPAGSDAEYHRKKSWWLVSPELYPWALLFLARACPGVSAKHTHAPLKGSSPIPGVPLTRIAQQYAPALCAAWGLTVKAAFQEWHWEKYLQERSALHALEVCWQDLQCPAWPSDGAKSVERSLGTTTADKPPRPQAGECPHYQPCGGWADPAQHGD